MQRRTATLTWTAPLAVVCLMLTAGAALAQSNRGGLGGPAIMPEPDLHDYGHSLPPEPMARADGYRLQGRCDVAIGIYRALVAQGKGYELAQFYLGRCLLETAKKAPDPATAAAQRREAGDWTVKAANNGLPNAENALVAMYLDGEGVTADPVEAGKWSLIYHDNGARRMYRLPDVTPTLQARLDAVLNDNAWAQAQARASAWSPAQ
jgi:TPR repeat protein